MKKTPVAVLGAGNMGTALSKVIGENGFLVKLWNYSGDQEPLVQIQKFGENKKYLSGIFLPKNVEPVFDMEQALLDVELVFVAVSSGAVESVMKEAQNFIQKGMIFVDVSKGFHPKTHELIPDVIERLALPKKISVVGLTGPAVARQFAVGEPAVMVAASRSVVAAKSVQKVLQSETLRIVVGKDLVGGEVVQSFKNVYAIGLGVAQGLGFGLNTQAILFTRALQEIAQLNQSLGGKSETVYGFAGLGDFLTTALSSEGRNRRFGECLGRGLCQEEAIQEVQQTVEGIAATRALKSISKKHGLRLEFASVIDQIIQERIDPRIGMEKLLKKIL